MTRSDSPLPPPEFSRLIAVDSLPSDRATQEISATQTECAALAERFDLLAIHSLSATLKLRRYQNGDLVEVSGILRAEVVQSCVVTLEPVTNQIQEEFSCQFIRHAPDESDELDLLVDPDALDEDPPEAMDQGRIDLGELTAQHLSLALDPYPHRDTEFPDHIEDMDGGPVPANDTMPPDPALKPSPFAVLAGIKPKSS